MTCFIRAACLKDYETLVASYQVDPIPLLKQSGIIPSQLQDPDAFLYYEHFLKALEKAKIACQNDVFGFQLGSHQSVHNLGIIKNYICRQASVLDAFIALNKYIHLYAEGFSLTISNSHHDYQIQFNHLHPSYFTPQKAQFSLAACFTILTELLGFFVAPRKICLKQATPKHYHEFQHHFGCPIEFKANEDAMYFPPSVFMQKPALALKEELLHLPQEQLLDPKHDVKTLDYVQQTIKSLLATGECNQANIALTMDIHPKKLQRLLAHHHTCYREILEQVRRQEAMRLLQQTELSFTIIALKLGYTELAIFSRNFKKWFGCSPTQWRQ